MSKTFQFAVYLYLSGVMGMTAVLLWVLYAHTRSTTKRYLVWAGYATFTFFPIALLTLTAGEFPVVPIATIRDYIVNSRLLEAITATALLFQLLAKFWFLLRGSIPWWLRKLSLVDADDV